jgi:predicted amidohydrolase
LADAGADVIVVPAAWVRGPLKEQQWELLLRARAVENTTYMVAAGQNGARCIGNSMVVDPMGSVIAGRGDGTGIVTASLDGELVAGTRATNPSLANRRYRVVPKE